MSCCARMRSTVELLPLGIWHGAEQRLFPLWQCEKSAAYWRETHQSWDANHGWHQNDNSFGWNDTSFYSPGAWKDDEDFWNPDR